MQESMYGYMKVGIVHFKAFPDCVRGEGPIVETVRKIAEDDFWTAIEMGWIKDLKVRDEVRAILQTSHIAIAYGTQPAIFSQKLNLNHFDPKERKRAVNQVKNCINEAYHLGAKWIRVPAGKDPGDEKRPEAMKLFVDSMRQICDCAKEYDNMGVHVKIFDRDIDKESLIGFFPDALEIAKQLRPYYDQFGLLADLSHFPLLKEDMRKSLELVKDFLVHCHLGNAICRDPKHFLYGDLQPRLGHPDGEIDVPEVAEFYRILADIGFLNPKDRPIVSAEVRPLLQYETSELVIANTKRVIKEAWALA